MSLKDYLKDHFIHFLLYGLTYFFIFAFLSGFNCDPSLIIAIIVIMTIQWSTILTYDYLRRSRFYRQFNNQIEKLDQKYLIIETLVEPSFKEGKWFYQQLYIIDKSMVEHINEYKKSIDDFKEYVEMWIHEVKLPIASLTLMGHNYQNDLPREFMTQIHRLNNYSDSILYYLRSQYASKDYTIKEVNLDQIVQNVIMNYRYDLLEKGIQPRVEIEQTVVLSDGKWLEFMISQIVSNCVKYANKKEAYILFRVIEHEKEILLQIKDNGLGIDSSDIDRVFEKTFTGKNGQNQVKSTGMGLYIVKELCKKLGHQVKIDSVYQEYTEVTLIFSKNDYYKF